MNIFRKKKYCYLISYTFKFNKYIEDKIITTDGYGRNILLVDYKVKTLSDLSKLATDGRIKFPQYSDTTIANNLVSFTILSFSRLHPNKSDIKLLEVDNG